MSEDSKKLAERLPNNPHIQHAIKLINQEFGDRLRKDKSEPMINHSLRVGNIIAPYVKDNDEIIAALLHDILEDSKVSADQINQHYGTRVISLVESLTEDNRNDSWEERKKMALIKLSSASDEALLIKTADQIDNLETFIRFAKQNPKDIEVAWSIFSRGRNARLAQWKAMFKLISQRYINIPEALLKRYVTALEEVNNL
ncbi:bifunctional (p)ppGpp synthetase/guanosine-3',5'-bis(diphosphate) 3'-pyrophosphohydrolase [candidate division WWE3 bacterium]|nr:bifunctional (p)ppGpp synthetase/guanosine-3',5'-bis(diphosphate) 3'-pyrophosphohydrolase [candidate division WWE3 bacterium]